MTKLTLEAHLVLNEHAHIFLKHGEAVIWEWYPEVHEAVRKIPLLVELLETLDKEFTFVTKGRKEDG